MKLVINSHDRKLSTDHSVMVTYNTTGPSCPTSCMFHPDADSVGLEKREKYGRKTVCYTSKGKTYYAQRHAGLIDAIKLRKGVADFLRKRRLNNPRLKVVNRVRAVRWHVSGDCLIDGQVSSDYVDALVWSSDELRNEGIPAIGYTHAWRDTATLPLQPYFLASCDNADEVNEATAGGWMCALVVNKNNIPTSAELNGAKLVMCPNQTTNGKIKCADCMLCSVSNLPKFNQRRVIGFYYH
jgi:hypothetical protein